MVGLGATVLALAFFRAPARAGTLCVKPGGGDGCEASISDALTLAQEGDTILVATGVYSDYVLITRTITLQGGWAEDFSVRDLSVYTSTIRPPINMVNPDSVVHIQGQPAEPAAVAPTLDGFLICCGRADLGSNHGGGIKITNSDARVISNTIIENGAFLLGGGIWVHNGAPWIEGNRIEGNASFGYGQEAYGGRVQLEGTQAILVDNLITHNVVSGTTSYGGGVDVYSSSGVDLVENVIDSNTTMDTSAFGYGGGISVRDSSVNISGTMFSGNLAINGGGGLWVNDGVVTLTTSLLSGNYAANGAGLYNFAEAGESSVVLTDTVINANGLQAELTFMGGSIYNLGGPLGAGATTKIYGSQITNNTSNTGAGITNHGLYGGEAVMSIASSTVSGNIAAFSEGGISNDGYTTKTLLTLTDSLVSGNVASDGDAGGIYSNASLTMTRVTVTANSATEDGGGLKVEDSKAAIYNSTICNNVADSDGENGGDGGGIYNIAGSEIVLEDSSVCENSAASFGGGIFNFGTLTTTNSSISNNIADDGGALFVEDATSLTTILSGVLNHNIARQSAGAINNSGTLVIGGSTFSDNLAEDASAGAVLNNGKAIITNATLSGNTAGGFGGALRNLDTLTMTNVTIHGNEALVGDGLYNDEDAWLVNTILAGNHSANCDGNPVVSLGYNLEDADTCSLNQPTDLTDTEPLLGPLALNGGTTPNHALLAGSPAIDAGDNVLCPAVDQRGAPRPFDGDGDGQPECDIGAFEFGVLFNHLYLPVILKP